MIEPDQVIDLKPKTAPFILFYTTQYPIALFFYEFNQYISTTSIKRAHEMNGGFKYSNCEYLVKIDLDGTNEDLLKKVYHILMTEHFPMSLNH